MGKHNFNESDSIEIMTTIVPFLIQEIYVEYLQLCTVDDARAIIMKYFTLPSFHG